MDLLTDIETKDMIERLSSLTGESEIVAIRQAVKERLDRLVANDREAYIARIRAITSRVAAMPVLDNRSADEILGYNEFGHFD